MRAALLRHDNLIEEIVAQHHDSIVRPRGEGDSRFAVFETASDAVAAACAIQVAIRDEEWPFSQGLQLHMGVHSGEADLHAGDYYGGAVNRCARLRSLAHGGQILLSGATYDLVCDAPEGWPPDSEVRALGEHRLVGLARPERIFQLRSKDAESNFPPIASSSLPADNLPLQLTSFVGRSRDRVEVQAALRTHRLVTLTGSGGCGKTYLALEVASELRGTYANGIMFVDLAPLTDPGLVAFTVAATLGLREASGQAIEETLQEFLRERALLVLLDNFEHVISAATLVATLLSVCPRLVVLATSRSRLRVRGEYVVRLQPLSIPSDDGGLLPAVVAESEAVQLFVVRARDVDRDFALTPANAPAVAKICARLDGLLLALELAAAQMERFTADELLTGLGEPLKVLVEGPRDLPDRQQKLHQTIEWSHALLSAPEQTLFRRLGIFLGGCDVEAAQAVCDPDRELAPDVTVMLEALVHQSLLRREKQNDGTRFRLLETIRAYALERLTDTAELEGVRQKYAHYFLSLAAAAAPELRGPAQGRWLARLELEHANMRFAVGESPFRTDLDVELGMVAALWQFWVTHGHLSEGRVRAERVLARTAGADWRLRVRALNAAAVMAWQQGAYEQAEQRCEESLALSRQSGEADLSSFALNGLGNVAWARGDYDSVRKHYEESLTLRRRLGDQANIATCLNNLGTLASDRGDYEQA
jgi:predicted ATPase